MNDIPKSAPLVSVAMITYNHERFVTQAIESVLAQRTTFPIELVIGDDASCDGTAQQIEALRDRAPEVIRPLIRPTNIGANQNLENVLETCRGEFVAFLEGDDYWLTEEKLQIQVGVLRTYTNAVGVFHSVNVVDALGRETGKIQPEKAMTEIGTRELSKGDIIPTASVMMRRDAIVSLPDSCRELIGRDWVMWTFASLRGPWRFYPKVMAARRIHDGGVWSSLSDAARRTAEIEMFREFSRLLPRPFSAIARERLTQKHLAALEEALACNQPADARRQLREIVRLLSYCRASDSRRLVNAFWKTLSPRTHQVVKRALHPMR